MNFVECNVPKTLIIKSLYTAFEANLEIDYTFDGETHDFWEAVFVLDGSIGVCAGNRILTLNRGDAILHEPMEFHRLWSENGTKPDIIVISFRAHMRKIKNRIVELPENEFLSLRNILASIKSSYEINKGVVKCVAQNSAFEAELCIKELENLILKLVNRHQKSYQSVIANRLKSALTYADVVRFLEEHVTIALNVEDIAAGCNMSRSNLKKIFTKYSGMGVMKYFNMLKIKQAENYLKSGMSVGEIADKLGYCDQNYFSTVFKKQTGCTPSEYFEM